MTQGIKVADLQNTGSFANTSSILLLTDNQNNTVNLLAKNAFIQSIVNSGTDNGIEVINNQLKVANIGNLADLDTSDKTSVVNAINEVKGDSAPVITTLETSGTIALEDNSINTIQPTAAITFTLPTITDTGLYHQILIQLKLTDTSFISGSNLGTNYFFGLTTPTFDTVGNYDIIYAYDTLNSKWCCGVAIKREIT